MTGVTSDGGYADYMIAPADALARVPADLSSIDGAPLMCAGITTFNALRNSGARPGETVAVLGLGGLGHLGVQFAAKLGFRTVAIARAQDKVPLAHQLGAHHYIDNARTRRQPCRSSAGAKAILATVTSSEAMNSVQGGLAAKWHADGDRRCRRDHNRCPCAAQRASIDQGLVFGNVDRLAGNPRIQCTDRRAANDRDLPAGAGLRSL